MVAITILAVLVVLFGQMLGVASKIWIYGHGRANNFTKARAMLELFAQDIQSGVFRPDLTAFPPGSPPSVPGTILDPTTWTSTPPTWTFFTSRPGIPASAPNPATKLRSLSTVQYSFTPPTVSSTGVISNSLVRSDYAILWTDQATTPMFSPALSGVTGFPTGFPTPQMQRNTAPGVVAFAVVFIQADGTLSYSYTASSVAGVTSANPTRAICIALAVLDDIVSPKFAHYAKSQPASLTALLNATLPIQSTTTPYNYPAHSVKAYWDGYLTSAAMNWSNYPQGTGSSLATFERYVTLPNAP